MLFFNTERCGNRIVNQLAILVFVVVVQCQVDVCLVFGSTVVGIIYHDMVVLFKSSLCVRLFMLRSLSSIRDAIVRNHSLELELE